jgi:hypothetical protein
MVMKSIALELKWALIFVAAGMAWTGLERLTGLHGTYIAWHAVVTNFFIVVAVLVYFLALRAKRAAVGGTITFKKAFLSGLLITLFVTLLTPLWQYLSASVISPRYFEQVAAYTISQKQMTAAQAASYFSLKNYMIQSVIFAPVAGIITSLLAALIVSRKKAI